jgi:acyl-CoA synthetase (AMP-forming)/AMP-acid ligase II
MRRSDEGGRVRSLARAALTGVIVLLAGCNIVGALVVMLAPPQIQKAEFQLTRERLAVLIDMARPEEESVVFRQALHDKLVEIFTDNNVKTQVIPQEEVQRLRQQNQDFKDWGIQKIGRRLNAKQVLWVCVDRLQLRENPGSPLLTPVAQLRLKVIGSEDAATGGARLWPTSAEPDGRSVQRARPAQEASSPMAIDEEARKLGKDAACLVAMPFYNVDLEVKTPWEP